MLTHYYVLTLANSIIGVSVLAMPFCFKQCGVILATIMLILSAIMTRVVCYFLLKVGTITRRRTYELLAYQTFGRAGKFIVEITIIGFLLGTLIAFMVVMGDLGPQIVAEILDVQNNGSLRTVVMTALSLFVALPLGLLRNIDSLSSVSALSFLFYLFLALKIFSKGIGPLWAGELVKESNFFRPEGVLQCIPIIAMALSCQTQIFAIYDSLPDPSLAKMNEIVRQAVNLCTSFYFCIGLFGYTGFMKEGISGNILLSFGSSGTTQLIKLCFVMSIAMSFPLCIFPCRASLHSLIFRGSHFHSLHDISTNYIPEGRLRLLTVLIVGVTLIIGLMIPNIELVLGLVGSTAGSIICIILPSLMFIKLTSKNTTERLAAQFIFCIGIIIMVLTTYVTLYGASKAVAIIPEPEPQFPVPQNPAVIEPAPKAEVPPANEPKFEHLEAKMSKVVPKAPISSTSTTTTSSTTSTQSPSPLIKVDREVADPAAAVVESKFEDQKILAKIEQPVESREISKNEQQPEQAAPEPIKESKMVENIPSANIKSLSNNTEKQKPSSFVLGPEEFLKKLEESQVEQKKLIEEQKVLLAELKQHHEIDHHLNGAKDPEPAKKVLENLEDIAQIEAENLQKIEELKKGLEDVQNGNVEDTIQKVAKLAQPPIRETKSSTTSPNPPIVKAELSKDKFEEPEKSVKVLEQRSPDGDQSKPKFNENEKPERIIADIPKNEGVDMPKVIQDSQRIIPKLEDSPGLKEESQKQDIQAKNNAEPDSNKVINIQKDREM